MTRHNIDPTVFVSGIEAWDALLRDIVTAIAKAPFPVAEYANLAALPAAGSYDRCMATTIDTSKLYFSSGGTWREVTLV
jgi:hypothetical protein